MCNPCCPCWEKNIKNSRKCPICGHIFQGNGWDGIDAHYRAKHEKKDNEPYEIWWGRMCDEHKARK